MKAAFLLCSLALLILASAAFAEPRSQPPAAPAQEVTATAPAAPTAASVELALQKIFEPQKPARRAASCYDDRYEYCQTFCWELSQTNGCDFFANQECL